MRILHLISQRPESTGSGMALQALADQARKNGHQNFLVAGVPQKHQPPLFSFSKDNCKFVEFETPSLPFPIIGMSDQMPYKSACFSDLSCSNLKKYKTAFEKKISDAVHHFKPDIIHSHHLWIVSGIAKRLFPNLPVVASCHGSDLRQQEKCGFLFKEDIEHCRDLDHILALTQIQKKEILNRYPFSPQKITVVGSGYAPEHFHQGKKEKPATCHILFAGKISKAKGVDWLLRSISHLKHLSFTLHLVGGGDGEEHDACLKLAKKLGDKVKLHGMLPQKELAELMRKSHIFVLPSFFEGLPLVLLEALSCGCRIITTALPGIQEIFSDISSNSITLLKLPRLETIDAPFEKDLQRLEIQLANAITGQIQYVEQSAEVDLPSLEGILKRYTWGNIFQTIESIYQNLITDSTKGE